MSIKIILFRIISVVESQFLIVQKKKISISNGAIVKNPSKASCGGNFQKNLWCLQWLNLNTDSTITGETIAALMAIEIASFRGWTNL
jgi:hypothetical protein